MNRARFSLVQLRRAKSLGVPMILSDIEIRGEQTAAKPFILELTICSSGREEHGGEVPMIYETVLARLIANQKLKLDDEILIICGGKFDREVLLAVIVTSG